MWVKLLGEVTRCAGLDVDASLLVEVCWQLLAAYLLPTSAQRSHLCHLFCVPDEVNAFEPSNATLVCSPGGWDGHMVYIASLGERFQPVTFLPRVTYEGRAATHRVQMSPELGVQRGVRLRHFDYSTLTAMGYGFYKHKAAFEGTPAELNARLQVALGTSPSIACSVPDVHLLSSLKRVDGGSISVVVVIVRSHAPADVPRAHTRRRTLECG